MTTLIVILLVLLLVGALPNWPHMASYGYSPAVVLLVILIVFLILGPNF